MKHKEDPVVEEVQRIRKKIFEQCDYDTGKLFELIKEASRRRKFKTRKKHLLRAA